MSALDMIRPTDEAESAIRSDFGTRNRIKWTRSLAATTKSWKLTKKCGSCSIKLTAHIRRWLAMNPILEPSNWSSANQRSSTTFLVTAFVTVAIVFIGFLPTYWIPVFTSLEPIRSLLHMHAALFFGWVVLFLVQSILVRQNRLLAHRRIGKIAAAWAIITITTGVYLAIETIARDLELIDGTFNAVPTFIPLTQIFMFACFIAAALANIRKPDVHKRFMVLAALVATTPAFARLFLAALGEPSLIVVGSIFLASNGLIVIVAWYDAICNNRLHPIFLYGGLSILLIRIARVPFAISTTWRETAEFISRLTS